MPYGQYSVASWLDDWAQQTLAGLGLNAEPWRMEFLEVWSHFETAGGQSGTGVYYNPLGTTYPGPGHSPNYGGQENVWQFDSVAHGAYATAMTIKSYPLLIQALSAEIIPVGLADVIGGTWGTGGFAQLLRDGWTPSASGPPVSAGTPPPPTTPNPAPVTLPPGPYPMVDVPPDQSGYLNVPNASLVPGQLNIVQLRYTAIIPPAGPGYWSYWQWTGQGWQEYNAGEHVAAGQILGLLPPGLSLPGGLTARASQQGIPSGTITPGIGFGQGAPIGAVAPTGTSVLPGPGPGGGEQGMPSIIPGLPGPPPEQQPGYLDIEGAWANYLDWNNHQIPAYVGQLGNILRDMQGVL